MLFFIFVSVCSNVKVAALFACSAKSAISTAYPKAIIFPNAIGISDNSTIGGISGENELCHEDVMFDTICVGLIPSSGLGLTKFLSSPDYNNTPTIEAIAASAPI